MSVIRVFMPRISGNGDFTCRRCSHRVFFHDSAWLQLTDDGRTVWLLDVANNRIVHKCGTEYAWVCDGCRREGEFGVDVGRAVRARRSRQGQVTFSTELYDECACGGRFRQRATTSAA